MVPFKVTIEADAGVKVRVPLEVIEPDMSIPPVRFRLTLPELTDKEFMVILCDPVYALEMVEVSNVKLP